MKIAVCVKQVPAKDAPLSIAPSGTWIRESDIGFEMNEPDSYALEEGLRLKEKHGGEVVAISMGPEVFTVEPGIYIREEELGVRLENDVLITKKGAVDLMKDVPVETGEIEDLMSRRNHGG